MKYVTSFCLLLVFYQTLPAQYRVSSVERALRFGETDTLVVYGPGTGTAGDWVLDPSALRDREDLQLLGDTSMQSGQFKEHRLYFAVFDTGRVALAGLRAILPGRDTQTLDTVYLTIGPREGKREELAPIRDIHTEPLRFSDLLPWLIGLIALILIVWGIRLWLRKRRPDKEIQPVEVPTIHPYTEALQSLRALADSLENGEMDYRSFYIELSLLLRRYIERRYGVPALESTSGEIAVELENRLIGDEETRSLLVAVLRRADLVKYAKSRPAEEQWRWDLDKSREGVEQLEKTKEEEE